MPTLHWVGKDKVVNHHHDVPFRVLNKVSTFAPPPGLPVNSTDNRIIHGDNLEALKSLLPEFEGQVKCIYIDPPYNTGNEGWVYNDAVNDPKMKRWLGQVVGKEGEDLSRHDKWLCMMYPRLKLLHRLLRTDGVLFVSIDRNEMATIKLLLEEVFGAANWVGEIAWRNVTDNNPTNISLEHEYVLCFAKSKSALSPVWKSPYLDAKERLIELGHELSASHPDEKKLQVAYSRWFREHKAEVWPFQDYKFIDADGIYTGSRSVHNPGKEGYRYDVFHPLTQKACKQPLMGYRFPYDTMQELLAADRIRSYVAYSEGIPVADRASTQNPHSPYLLGLNRETAWFFHYEPDRATSLDMDFLAGLRFGGGTGASKPATVIIYADRCLLSAAFMAQHGIIFKKIPRDITRF